jgi:hypothetical protein
VTGENRTHTHLRATGPLRIVENCAGICLHFALKTLAGHSLEHLVTSTPAVFRCSGVPSECLPPEPNLHSHHRTHLGLNAAHEAIKLPARAADRRRTTLEASTIRPSARHDAGARSRSLLHCRGRFVDVARSTSSIERQLTDLIAVRVRPFTIREAAQVYRARSSSPEGRLKSG